MNTFPKGIYPKANIIARLEFELAYCNDAVQHLSHYTTETKENAGKRKKEKRLYLQWMKDKIETLSKEHDSALKGTLSLKSTRNKKI